MPIPLTPDAFSPGNLTQIPPSSKDHPRDANGVIAYNYGSCLPISSCPFQFKLFKPTQFVWLNQADLSGASNLYPFPPTKRFEIVDLIRA